MNFYLILGLEQDASPADIERAYRRLSRRYHPGVNPGDRAAEAMFRQITEAYETLSDPSRRRQYDDGAAPAGRRRRRRRCSSRSSISRCPRAARRRRRSPSCSRRCCTRCPALAPCGRKRARTFTPTLTIDFAASIRGVERQIVVTRQVPCGQCRGAGHTTVVEARCAQCKGSGAVRWARGHMVFSKPCPGCGGTGRQSVQRCGACNATGRTVRGEAVGCRRAGGHGGRHAAAHTGARPRRILRRPHRRSLRHREGASASGLSSSG